MGYAIKHMNEDDIESKTYNIVELKSNELLALIEIYNGILSNNKIKHYLGYDDRKIYEKLNIIKNEKFPIIINGYDLDLIYQWIEVLVGENEGIFDVNIFKNMDDIGNIVVENMGKDRTGIIFNMDIQ